MRYLCLTELAYDESVGIRVIYDEGNAITRLNKTEAYVLLFELRSNMTPFRLVINADERGLMC